MSMRIEEQAAAQPKTAKSTAPKSMNKTVLVQFGKNLQQRLMKEYEQYGSQMDQQNNNDDDYPKSILQDQLMYRYRVEDKGPSFLQNTKIGASSLDCTHRKAPQPEKGRGTK